LSGDKMMNNEKDPIAYRLGSNAITGIKNYAKNAYARSDALGKSAISFINNGAKQLTRDVTRPFVSHQTSQNIDSLLSPPKQLKQPQQRLGATAVPKNKNGGMTTNTPQKRQAPLPFKNALSPESYSPQAKQQRNDYYNKNSVDNGDGTTSINMLGGTVSGGNRGMQNMLKGQAKNNRYSLDYLNAIAQQGGSFKDQYDGTPLVENGRVLDNPYGYQENKQSPQENSLNYVRSGSRTALGGGDSSVNMLNTNNQVNNIRDNSQKSISDAVKKGNISANQGSELLPRAKLGGDYISPEQKQAMLNARKTNADINLVNAQASKALNKKTGKPAFTIETLNSLLPVDTRPEIKQRLSTIDAGFWGEVNQDVANAKSQDEVDNIIRQLMQKSGINDPAIFNALIFQGGY